MFSGDIEVKYWLKLVSRSQAQPFASVPGIAVLKMYNSQENTCDDAFLEKQRILSVLNRFLKKIGL